jgi:ribosomal protein S18 acetylase RimI-like enzyme
MTKISPLKLEDSPSLASLHLQNLRTNYSGRPGLELLHLYYKSLIGANGGCGFVAEQEGQIQGYVCGIWDPDEIRRYLIKNYGVNVILWGLAQSMSSPKIIGSLISRFMPKTDREQDLKFDFELRPIVVSSGARGTGLAGKLVERLAADAVERGFRKIQLITEADNIAAQKFYLKTGFCESGTITRNGITYLQFVKKLFYEI